MFLFIDKLKKRLDERVYWKGRIRLREVPLDWTEADFLKFYPKMTMRERERWTVCESKNLLTTAGRNQLLNYCGAQTTSSIFCQYVAFGTFKLNTVQPGDTSLLGENYRGVPATSTVAGNSVDVSTFLNTSQANGNLTNCGIFGINATGTSGSGTLMTHVLFNYNKTNTVQITADYLITVN